MRGSCNCLHRYISNINFGTRKSRHTYVHASSHTRYEYTSCGEVEESYKHLPLQELKMQMFYESRFGTFSVIHMIPLMAMIVGVSAIDHRLLVSPQPPFSYLLSTTSLPLTDRIETCSHFLSLYVHSALYRSF